MWNFKYKNQYLNYVSDLMQDTAVQSMRLLPQHRAGVSCYHHSVLVSYASWRVCDWLGLDARAAARGGLLHDFYLYNWRDAASHPGIRHGSQHPEVALRNARARFSLTWREEDIILSHMFPYTPTKVYRCLESAVVSTMDKLCAAAELVGLVPLLTRFRRERLGFIFQDCNLLDTLTAFENIALSLSILRTPAAQIRDRVEETAELLGIGDCLDKYPYQMSGGQQQRCAAARAIVTRPALVLADEPTGALDSKSSRLLLERLEVLNRERGATILMVTHDAFTASCCRRVVFLRDGKIFAQLERDGGDRRALFQQIIRVVTQLGGEMEDVL